MSNLKSWPRAIRLGALGAVFVFVAACSSAPGGGTPGASPGPTIIPAPSGGAPLTAGQLRLLLIDTFGPHLVLRSGRLSGRASATSRTARWRDSPRCRPRATSTSTSRRSSGSISSGPVTDAQKLAIYQVWKVALSIPLDPIGDGSYRFDYLAQGTGPAPGAAEGLRTGGTIDSTGKITIDQQVPTGEPMCPICLARGTLIDTPNGEIAVDALRLGDPSGRSTRAATGSLGPSSPWARPRRPQTTASSA